MIEISRAENLLEQHHTWLDNGRNSSQVHRCEATCQPDEGHAARVQILAERLRLPFVQLRWPAVGKHDKPNRLILASPGTAEAAACRCCLAEIVLPSAKTTGAFPGDSSTAWLQAHDDCAICVCISRGLC